MTFCTNTKNAQFFDSVSDIPEAIFDALECERNIYLSKAYLSAIENNHPEISFNYVVLFDPKGNAIALSTIQLVNFFLDEVNNSIEKAVVKVKKVFRRIGVFPDKKPIKLLISGNVFVSGEHGIFIKENQNKKQVIRQLANTVLNLIQKNKKLSNSIDAFMLKDFWDESLFITNELKRYNFHPFSVEPNMRFEIRKDWSTFDDYLASMKTKFRVKAKKALTQSRDLIPQDLSTNEIRKFLPEVENLYQKVAKSASFNLTTFNLESCLDLKQKFGDNYLIRCYWLDEKLVGFLSGIVNYKTLDAHFVGINYSLNRPYAIYQRMLYDYIDFGINHQLSAINFGRTASEIKSSVGAEPENLTIYLRHRKRFTNKLLKLFLLHVQPTPFHQKFPFKTINA